MLFCQWDLLDNHWNIKLICIFNGAVLAWGRSLTVLAFSHYLGYNRLSTMYTHASAPTLTPTPTPCRKKASLVIQSICKVGATWSYRLDWELKEISSQELLYVSSNCWYWWWTVQWYCCFKYDCCVQELAIFLVMRYTLLFWKCINHSGC